MATTTARKANIVPYHFFEDNSVAPIAAAPARPSGSTTQPIDVIDKRSGRGSQATPSQPPSLAVLSRSAPTTPEPRKQGRRSTSSAMHAQSASKRSLTPFDFGGNPMEGLGSTGARHSVSDLSSVRALQMQPSAPRSFLLPVSESPLMKADSPSPPPPPALALPQTRTSPSSPSSQRFADKGRPLGRALPNPMAHPASLSLAVGGAGAGMN